MLHENDRDDVIGPIIVGWCSVAYGSFLRARDVEPSVLLTPIKPQSVFDSGIILHPLSDVNNTKFFSFPESQNH